jgi:CRISPR/Cas system-associated exonuclease Cas4 (RecB family)
MVNIMSSAQLSHQGEILFEHFVFSQSSLQDYHDCARRFQLRYLKRLAWPAQETQEMAETERLLDHGNQFHQLVQQYWMGLDTERLSESIHDQDLNRWWDNFISSARSTLGLEDLFYPTDLFPEISLSTPIGKYRLIAKYDLLARRGDGKWLIIDWKTARKRLSDQWYGERLQTSVYPYLLVQAGAEINDGEAISPNQIEMAYWFSDHPQNTAWFPYGQMKFDADQEFLKAMIGKIANTDGESFPKTENKKSCAFCVYRSLCERGDVAGTLDDFDDFGEDEPQIDFDVDFDQIQEIEF